MVKSDSSSNLISLLFATVRLVKDLLYAGVAWGAIAAYFGLATASGEAAVAKNAVSLILGLGVVLPAMLAFQVWLSLRGNSLDKFYAIPAKAYTLLALTGLLGGIVGIVGFMVSATIIPALFGKLDSVALGTNFRDNVDLLSIILIIVVTFLVGLGLARWATGAKRPGQKIS